MALHTRYHRQDIDELPAHHGIVLVHPLDETFLCGISCSFMFRNERRESLVELEREVAVPLILFIKKVLLGKCTGIKLC